MAVHDMAEKLCTIMALRALDQKMIEHGDSETLASARHELVKLYALSFRAVAELELVLGRSNRTKLMFAFKKPVFDDLLANVEDQNARVESIMNVARLSEPQLDAALIDRTHTELLTRMREELDGHFHMLEQGMQQRLEEVERRVVASVQDMLPGIIREEMRKVLAEHQSSTSESDQRY